MPFQALASVFNTKQTNEARKRESELAYKRSIEDWNRQNAYNDPSAQMARLKAAGLNPNMVYGTGTAAATGSGAPARTPQYQPADQEYNLQAPSALGMLGQYQSIEKAKADTALKWGQLGVQALTIDSRKLSIEQQELQNQILRETGMEIARNTIGKQEASIEATKAGTAKTKVDTRKSEQSIINLQAQFDKMQQEIANLKQTGKNLQTANRLQSVKAEIEEKYLQRWKDTGVDPKSSGFLRILGDAISLIVKAEKGNGQPVTFNQINEMFPNQIKDLTKEQLSELYKLINAQY